MKNFFILLLLLSTFFPKLSAASIVLNTHTSLNEASIQSKFKAQNAFTQLRQEQKAEKKLERKVIFATRIIKIFGLQKLEQKFFKKSASGTDTDKLLGILLGLVLGLIGVLIAYIIGNNALIRGAWIGLIIWLVIILLALALKK